MASLRWSRRMGWTMLTIAALCALALGYLVASTALDKDTSDWAKAFLFGLGAIAVVAALLISEGSPWDARHWTSWLQPRPIAALFVAIFISFGLLTDALSLLEPRPAVETEPGIIENMVRDIHSGTHVEGTRGAPPRILQRIGGTWGEPGCAVTHRFQVRDAALIIEGQRRPAGAPPFRRVATITSARGDVLHSVGDQPTEDRGKSATFTYSTNGVIERLTWNAQVSEAPLVLDRCA